MERKKLEYPKFLVQTTSTKFTVISSAICGIKYADRCIWKDVTPYSIFRSVVVLQRTTITGDKPISY
jgi:hypothetical protein